VNEILITGNKKTKEHIILRELNFKKGDTIAAEDLKEIILKSKNRIFNTTLFVTVDIATIPRNRSLMDFLIIVKERWYIYPVPIFELADRNFNEWWQQRNRDPKRINLGIFYVQKNVRGRNETLRAKIQFGFTKKFELFYFIPYIDKKLRTGLNLEASYILNKQIPYKTSNHKLTYIDYNKFVRERFRAGFTFSYRKKFYQTHFAGATFNYNNIADTIAVLNPRYLLDGRTSQTYISMRYSFVKDVRDIIYYPLKGSLLRLDVEKLGIGIFDDLNQLNFIGEYSIYRALGKRFYFAGGVKQKISFPKNQPYLQTRALGYERDYVSGYELYVIDGQHFSLAKANIKWQLYSSRRDLSSIPVNQFETIPFAVYLKIYSDAGYVTNNVYNPENIRLSNKLLWGGGAGVDLVSYYDLVIRLEYSVNRLGQHGFFIHTKSIF
jgi:outer membrane protein assembly factor BamA